MLIARLFLVVALATVGVAGLLYLFTRDKRYLVFIGRALKYSIVLLAAVMLFFFIQRLML